MAKSETNLIFSTSQCAAVLGITSRQVRRLCASEKFRGAVKGEGWRGWWKIPASAHPALQNIQTVCLEDCREVQIEVLAMALLTEVERLKKAVLTIKGLIREHKKGVNNAQKGT
jgi:hypothetical protein